MCIHHNCIGVETLDEREADTAESLEQPGYMSNTVHTTAIQSKSSLVCRQTHPQLSLLPLSTLQPMKAIGMREPESNPKLYKLLKTTAMISHLSGCLEAKDVRIQNHLDA